MKKVISALGCALLLTPVSISAEENDGTQPLPVMHLTAMTRVDYQHDMLDGNTVKDNSGFEGKYLNFRIDGYITSSLTYSWRQRLNKTIHDSSFFDATDWIYLNYTRDRWSIAGGKQVVAIGGWEYDRHPADLYSCSVFWNNIACYQFGVSGSYGFTGSDRLTIQFCESPFFTESDRDLYSYNLMWTGSHGPYESIWSANLIEYDRNRYISYLALGNRFTADKWTLELDLMNRAAGGQTFFFRDMSVMGELAFRPDPRWRIFAKMTYDVNHADNGADMCVLPGTELTMAGGGVEFYPLINSRHTLRLHANAFYSWGKNANTADMMQNRTTVFDIGFKLHLDLVTIRR